jgi:hypothetical protein
MVQADDSLAATRQRFEITITILVNKRRSVRTWHVKHRPTCDLCGLAFYPRVYVALFPS